MAAKTIAFVIIILLIIGVIVVSNAPPTNDQGDEYIVDPETGDEYNPEEYLDPETLGEEEFLLEPPGFEKATTSDDCEKSEGFFRDVCYSNLALIKSDFTYCNSISQENYEIIDICFYDLAIQEKSSDLCLKMDFGITDCLREVALATLDPQHCEKAGFEKNTCLKAVSENDYSLCKKLGLNRRYCNDAVESKNTSICGNIIDASEKCFEELALKTNNPEYCKKITTAPDFCYYEIALATNNHNLCNLLKERNELCVALIAFNTNNPALCDLAGEERQSCLEDLQQ